MRVGVVLVHYRTPRLARQAVAALRASEGLPEKTELEIVLVDNGSDEGDLETLDGLGVHVLRPGENLGYAGGLNAGVRKMGPDLPDVLVPMNPDVHVEPDCLAQLVRALSKGEGSGADIAGPRFLWSDGLWRDGAEKEGDERRVLLPPADPVGRRWELLRYMASVKGGGWARRARSVWRRHAQRHWTAQNDLPSHALSGALLAVSKSAWHRVGPFDDGFRLYFEETDWLRRAAKKGVGALHVPAARAHHGYARATRREPEAEEWFAGSERRFRRRWYGRAFTGFLESLARRYPPPPSSSVVPDGAGSREPDAGPDVRWVEISASRLGLPSGGLYLPEGCAEGVEPLPAMVRQRAAETTLYWRTVDAGGRESTSVPVVEALSEH